MRVEVIEAGKRPILLTTARSDAPQAARFAGEVLAKLDIAEEAMVVLDWDNSTGKYPQGPKVKPMLYVAMSQRVPALQATVTVEDRIDVEATFGTGEMTGTLIQDFLMGIAEKLARELKEKGVR